MSNLEKYKKIYSILGCGEIEHSNRTLLIHLEETYQLLKEWDNSEEVCRAGFFHSIYGTDRFRKKPVAVKYREVVASHIGTKAENLVYIFCYIQRDSYYNLAFEPNEFILRHRQSKEKLILDRETFSSILEISLANRIEQIDHYTKSMFLADVEINSWIWLKFEKLLSPKAKQASNALYKQYSTILKQNNK